MSEVAQLLIDEARSDGATVYRISAYCHVDNPGSAGGAPTMRPHGSKAGLRDIAVFPNLGPEPQDCLMFGKAVR